MASRFFFSEEDLCCSVCYDVFKDPVLLPCSHSFCKACLEDCWREKPRECPVCRKRSSTGEPPCNLILKNLCDAFSRERSQAAPAESEKLCSQHGERFKLFCLHDQEPVCVACMHSEKHKQHSFRPADEAARGYREELNNALRPLQEKLQVFENVTQSYNKTAAHIKAQARRTETQMKEEFQKVRLWLQMEEEARMTALRVEEGRKSWIIKDKIEGLGREISTLSDTIQTIQGVLRTHNTSFLQNYKATMTRAQHTWPDPPPVSPQLINVASHLGNLASKMLDEMKKVVSYTPVILDPNTAHPSLIVSEDLTSVVASVEGQELPDNPERFDSWAYVLGSEGCSSGELSWDIEVGDGADWAVGVLEKSVQRKGRFQGRRWTFGFIDGQYVARPASTPVTVAKEKYERISVHLEWDKGLLSFYGHSRGVFGDRKRHLLQTFKHTFTEEVFPFIEGHFYSPLRVLSNKQATAQGCPIM